MATITEADLKELTLALGQKGALRAWAAKLAAPSSSKKSTVKPKSSVHEPSATGATAEPEVSSITLQALRSQQQLTKKVLKQMQSLGFDSDDSDTDDTDDEDKETRHRGKRSGRIDTGEKNIKYKTWWPNLHIQRAGETKRPLYDSLNLQEFVYGFLCDIDSCKDADKKKRLAIRLKGLMMDAMHFGWEATREFHGAFLQNVEQGYMDWGMDLTHLKTQFLLAPAKQAEKSSSHKHEKPDTKATFKKRDEGKEYPASGPIYCKPFQTGACRIDGESHDSVRGTVKHICAYCLKNAGKMCTHGEDKCIRKTKLNTSDQN